MNTKQLRQKILDLAIKGKLVPQDENDEPAEKLLEKIHAEKEQLIKDSKIKRDKKESRIFIGDDKLHYEQFSDESIACIEDEIPFEVPEGWAWSRLKNIRANIQNAFVDGPFGSDLKVEHYTDKEEVRLIQLNNIGEGFWKNSKKKYTTFKHADELARCKTFPKDIVIAKMMPAGRCILVPTINKQYIISSDCVKLTLHDFLNKIFIINLINSPTIQKTIQDETQGIGRSRTSLGKLKELLIPVPPLAEQERIAKTVEELLALVDKIEENKTDLAELIKQTKSKVLDLAIKGKLVPQDKNDEPAEKLLEKIRAEKEQLIAEGKIKRDKNESYIFKNSDDNSYWQNINGEKVDITDELPFEIPNCWIWCTLNQIGHWGAGSTPNRNKKEYYNLGTIPWLKTGDLNDSYIKSIPEHITELALKNTSLKIKQKDSILIAMYGATIGKLGILTFEATTNQACCVCECYSVNNKYLFYYLMSQRNKLKELGAGGAQPNISKDIIINYQFPLPPLNEQKRIVEKIEQIFKNIDIIENIVKDS